MNSDRVLHRSPSIGVLLNLPNLSAAVPFCRVLVRTRAHLHILSPVSTLFRVDEEGSDKT